MTDIATPLDGENYREFIENNDAVLIVFWAAWCGPCKMMSPVVNDVAQALTGKLAVGKLNVDEYPEIAEEYHVDRTSTLILFRNGKEYKRIFGYHSKEELTELIKKNI